MSVSLVLDTQVHVWAGDGPDNPWLPQWREYAHRGGTSPTAVELRDAMDAAGVDRAVLVAPTFGGDAANTAVALAMAAEYPARFAVVGRVDLAADGPDDVRGHAAQERLLGLRVTFGRGPSRHWLTDGTADWLWPVAEELGLPLMVSCPGRAADLLPVLGSHPELRLALDHGGVPPGARDRPVESLLEEAFPLADFAGVAIKASAFPSFADEPYPYPSARRWVRTLVSVFGGDRVLWGTDLTRGLPGSYAQSAGYLAGPGGLDPDDLPLVMGRAAASWLRWPE